MTGDRALEPIIQAFELQRFGTTTSPLYSRLLEVAIADMNSNGVCAEVMSHTPDGVEPVFDALPLRFLGGIHRLVLEGGAPDLARFYPSAGGAFDADPATTFLETVDAKRDAVIEGLARAVQTNEVGRCASLLPGFLRVSSTTGLPLRILELGASAGLNLRWDMYHYDGGEGGTTWGDADAALSFKGAFADPPPRLDVAATVVERIGCDRSPIDAGTAEGRLSLRSFVWPDQPDRLAALDAALSIGAEHPVTIDRADAAEWVVTKLRDRMEGAATVLFHSIVWQYLPRETRRAVKDAIRDAGARATTTAPLAWLRMEPGVEPTLGAEVRLTQWPSGDDVLLARTGYHGPPVQLLLDGD